MEIGKTSPITQTGNTDYQHKQPPSKQTDTEKEKQMEQGFNPEEILDVVKSLNDIDGRSVSFNVSEDPSYIQIKDLEGEVIRDIPPEGIRKIRENIENFDDTTGILVDIEA